jgi:uracil phosphoribosyltransferase
MDARVTIVGGRHSVMNQFLYELRDEQVQQDRMRFRYNLERVGEIMAYELSKHLSYESQTVTTPLGELGMELPDEQPILVSIMRAGLPFHQGFLRMFDQAENGFIAAYRHVTRGNEFVIKVEYTAVPTLTGRSVVIIDPMIATGKSAVLSYQEVVQGESPKQVFFAGVVGSEEGIEYVLRHIPQARILVGAIDHELTAKSYIVPGLGDAGDLAFGPK